jgi:branched-chain amino acid transport system permease protein
MFSGFFAGVAGGMSAVYFEIVTAENVGPMKSAAVMIATYIGGCASFAGPILGALVYVFFSVALSAYTAAWQFYMGLLFLWVVMFARGGLIEVLRGERMPRHSWRTRFAFGAAVLATLLGAGALVELAYRLSATSLPPRAASISALLDPQQPMRWIGAIALLTIGLAMLVVQHRRRRASR